MKKILVGLLFFTSIPLIAEEQNNNDIEKLNVDFYNKTINVVENYQGSFSKYFRMIRSCLFICWRAY